jgi:hypothetical protein
VRVHVNVCIRGRASDCVHVEAGDMQQVSGCLLELLSQKSLTAAHLLLILAPLGLSSSTPKSIAATSAHDASVESLVTSTHRDAATHAMLTVSMRRDAVLAGAAIGRAMDIASSISLQNTRAREGAKEG